MASSAYVDLYSYLPGLEVTQDEMLEAEILAQQLIKAKFPDIDMREGTAVRDLAIRPSATLLAMINKALMLYFSQNTLASVDNQTPAAFVDKLMSNWFLERKVGAKSVIAARLYFARSKNVSLSPDIYFSTDGTLKFFPIDTVTYAASQMTFESSSNQYYIDVDLQAETEGSSYNISSGSLIYFSNFDPYFLHAEISYLKEIASDPETNLEFLNRAPTAISTRNNINVPSISSNLFSTFNYLSAVTPIGMGDPEMIRDQIKILVPDVTDPVWIHNGGCVDVYCRTPLISDIVQLTTDNTGKAYITGYNYKIERSDIPGTDDPDTLPSLVTQSVASLTSTGTTATVVTGAAHGYSTGQKVTIAAASPIAYNGEKTITVVNPTTFTYTLASTLTSPATGTITAGVPVPFTLKNGNLVTFTVAIARTGDVATVTLTSHGIKTGERITISGADQAAYNGTFVVTSTPTDDTFTYAVTGAPATPATGTISAAFVNRYKEIGFSDEQVVIADFGAAYAGMSVSFLLYQFQGLDGIQEYLSNPETRVITSDVLARGYNLTQLDMKITSYNGVNPNSEACSKIINTYLGSLLPGQPFIMADLLSQLYAGGITTIQTPIDITYTKYWKDWLGTTTGTIVDVHMPNDTMNIFTLNSIETDSLLLQ